MVRRLCAALLAVLLLAVPVLAESAPSEPEETVFVRSFEKARQKRLWLILGGTVAGVTGMWLTLYRRGK